MGSLIAFIAGFVVVIGSIMSATDKPMAFIDIPSIIIVVGGTFVASFISYEAKNAVAGLKMALSTFRKHKDSENSLKDEVGRIVRWAYIIQKNGLQGLENEVTICATKTPFSPTAQIWSLPVIPAPKSNKFSNICWNLRPNATNA